VRIQAGILNGRVGTRKAFPLKVGRAPNFEPISKPANFVLAIRTGPASTRLSSGPLIATSADSVPPFNFDPDGSTTPRAGSNVIWSRGESTRFRFPEIRRERIG
jgi:hypothetical protein